MEVDAPELFWRPRVAPVASARIACRPAASGRVCGKRAYLNEHEASDEEPAGGVIPALPSIDQLQHEIRARLGKP
jgi:hypothetical protein